MPSYWLSLRAIGGAIATLVACGACCCGGGGAPLTTPSPSPLGLNQLAAWQNFPANDLPRPIVLHGAYMDLPAITCHKFTLESGVSTQTPSQATVTWTDGFSAAYPSISARDVFMAFNPTAPDTTGGCETFAPRVVTGARLETQIFDTDRGPARMPAWVFSLSAIPDTVSYPAIALSALWRGGRPVFYGYYSAVLSSDGQSLKVGFIGWPAGDGQCDGQYAVVAAESQVAVAVVVETVRSPAYGCQLKTVNRYVDVALKTPLGGRVVVDENANVVVVCPASPKPGSPACYSLPPRP